MKTIKGRVISATDDGKVAEIETKLGVYGINRVVRALTDFRSPVKKGDKLLLTIDPADHNRLLGIKQGD